MKVARRLILAATVAVVLPSFGVQAADQQKFSDAAFDSAMKAGKPILVDVAAPWCPTCKAQAPVIKSAAGEARFKDLVILQVDFDSQKDALKRLGARSQSTLITFKGGKEVGRSVGDSNPESIRKLIETTL